MDKIKLKILSILKSSWFSDLRFIFKKNNIVPWNINKRKIEIEITTRCSLACFNCDRSIRQAASNEDINVEQIKKFLDESIRLNWKWKEIKIIGGEPTLHPYFFEILDVIKRYTEFNSHCKIILSTNGFGKK
jgi:molybdenum cofactor biosynthesis enzyme MoaA